MPFTPGCRSRRRVPTYPPFTDTEVRAIQLAQGYPSGAVRCRPRGGSVPPTWAIAACGRQRGRRCAFRTSLGGRANHCAAWITARDPDSGLTRLASTVMAITDKEATSMVDSRPQSRMARFGLAAALGSDWHVARVSMPTGPGWLVQPGAVHAFPAHSCPYPMPTDTRRR